MSCSEYLYRAVGGQLYLYKNSKCFVVSMNIYHASLVIENNVLYVIGGKNEERSLASILALDLGSIETQAQPINLQDCSVEIGTLVFARVYHSSCIKNSVIYTLGGIENSSNTLEIFEIESKTNNLLCNTPFPIKMHTCCAVDDKIVIVGGQKSHSAYNENLFYYDLNFGTWKVDANIIPTPSARPALLALSNRLVISFGGWCKDCKFNNKTVVFDLKKSKMKVLKNYSFPEFYCSWAEKGKMLEMVDYCGHLNRINLERMRWAAEFEILYKKVWKRKKTFFFFLKFAVDKKPKLPVYLLKEVSGFL